MPLKTKIYDIHHIIRVQGNVEEIIPSIFEIQNNIYNKMDISFYVVKEKKRTKSKLFIDNLSGHTKIYYTSGIIDNYFIWDHTLTHCLPLYFVVNNIVMPLKLLQKGYSFVHAACVDYNGEGLLIVAPPNTGKTLTALSLSKLGFGYLSDDLTIIKGNKAYCYPSRVTINLAHVRHLNIPITLGEYLRIIMKGIAGKQPFRPFSPDIRIKLRQDSHNVVMQTVIKYIYFLDIGSEAIQELDQDEALKKLKAASSLEIRCFEDPLILSYLYKKSKEKINLQELQDLRDKIYEDLIRKVEAFSVSSKDKARFPKLVLKNIYGGR